MMLPCLKGTLKGKRVNKKRKKGERGREEKERERGERETYFVLIERHIRHIMASLSIQKNCIFGVQLLRGRDCEQKGEKRYSK